MLPCSICIEVSETQSPSSSGNDENTSSKDHTLHNFNERIFGMTEMFYTIIIILLMIIVRLIK
jgi:hypothetical protein